MKIFSPLLALLLAATAAHAQPFPVLQRSPDATTYAFFEIRAKKLRDGATVASATDLLAGALVPYGVKPCIVGSDSNGAIACGKPASPDFMLPVPYELFTYDLAFNFKDLPPIRDRKFFNKDSQYNQVYAVNFLQPVGGLPGDSRGRNPVHVQFAYPVTEFSMVASGGSTVPPASEGLQFIVNGVALAPQYFVPGQPTLMGVTDATGFTEVTIVAVGGQTQAFIATELAFLPMP